MDNRTRPRGREKTLLPDAEVYKEEDPALVQVRLARDLEEAPAGDGATELLEDTGAADQEAP